jgi:hypothetical protein
MPHIIFGPQNVNSFSTCPYCKKPLVLMGQTVISCQCDESEREFIRHKERMRQLQRQTYEENNLALRLKRKISSWRKPNDGS